MLLGIYHLDVTDQLSNHGISHASPIVAPLLAKDYAKWHQNDNCSCATVNEWYRLLADCVGANNVNMFKNNIDIYLRRAGYI